MCIRDSLRTNRRSVQQAPERHGSGSAQAGESRKAAHDPDLSRRGRPGLGITGPVREQRRNGRWTASPHQQPWRSTADQRCRGANCRCPGQQWPDSRHRPGASPNRHQDIDIGQRARSRVHVAPHPGRCTPQPDRADGNERRSLIVQGASAATLYAPHSPRRAYRRGINQVMRSVSASTRAREYTSGKYLSSAHSLSRSA